MDHRESLISELEAYRGRWPDEAATSDRFLELAHLVDKAPRRTCFPAHLTASALVSDPKKQKVLLCHHRKLGKWLQLGGHADGDWNLARVALKEAQEESGLSDLKPVVQAPVDLDVHLIPARGVEPEHWHFDVRYAFTAHQPSRTLVSPESLDLRWADSEEAYRLTTEPALHRLLKKLWSGAFALLLLLPLACAKVPIDATFGSEGIALFDVTPGKNDELRAIAVGADSSITLAGGTNGDFAVLRLDSEGKLDQNFGNKGIVTVDFAGAADTATGLSLTSDGGAIVAGNSVSGTSSAPALARLTKTGALDTTFGSGGKVRLTLSFSMETRAAAVASNGKILLVGRAKGANGKYAIALVALDRNGHLDRAFAGTGSVTNQVGPESDDLTGLILGTDGSPVGIGHSSRLGSRDGLVVKYDSSGRLQTNFGASGKRLVNVSATNPNLESTFSDDTFLGVASLPSQTFAAVGTTRPTTNTQALVARFNPGGSLDSSFGTAGISSFGVDGVDLVATAAAADPYGAIWVGGRIDFGGEHRYVLAKVGAGGEWSTDLGADGLFRTDFPAAPAPAVLTRLSDGRLLLGGTFQNSGHTDLGVVRLNP